MHKWRNWIPPTLMARMGDGTATLENIQAALQNIQQGVTILSKLRLNLYPTERKICLHKNQYTKGLKQCYQK